MKAKIRIKLLLLTSEEKTPGTAPSRMEAEEVRMNSFMFVVGLLRGPFYDKNWLVWGYVQTGVHVALCRKEKKKQE
jgi:hypothetical protein